MSTTVLSMYNRVWCLSRVVLTASRSECSNIKLTSTWCYEGKSGQARGRQYPSPKGYGQKPRKRPRYGHMSFLIFLLSRNITSMFHFLKWVQSEYACRRPHHNSQGRMTVRREYDRVCVNWLPNCYRLIFY